MSTVFGQIIAGEIPADKLYEDDSVIAIKDIAPVAPVHLLIVPKKAYRSLQEIPETDLGLLSHVTRVAQELARQFKIEDNYRFLTNNGEKAGQSVWHIHFHLIGGERLGPIA